VRPDWTSKDSTAFSYRNAAGIPLLLTAIKFGDNALQLNGFMDATTAAPTADRATPELAATLTVADCLEGAGTSRRVRWPAVEQALKDGILTKAARARAMPDEAKKSTAATAASAAGQGSGDGGRGGDSDTTAAGSGGGGGGGGTAPAGSEPNPLHVYPPGAAPVPPADGGGPRRGWEDDPLRDPRFTPPPVVPFGIRCGSRYAGDGCGRVER